MGTVVSGFSGPVAAVFLPAQNRLLREALLHPVEEGRCPRSRGAIVRPDMFEQIRSPRGASHYGEHSAKYSGQYECRFNTYSGLVLVRTHETQPKNSHSGRS